MSSKHIFEISIKNVYFSIQFIIIDTLKKNIPTVASLKSVNEASIKEQNLASFLILLHRIKGRYTLDIFARDIATLR